MLTMLALATSIFLAADDGEVLIVTLGDSITRGVRPGVKQDETYAALLEQALRKDGITAKVINVGIGGERTDQARKRLQRDVLSKKPLIVTIMYGTNDSYVDRGKKEPRLSAQQYEANLRQLVTELRQAGVRPILMTPPRWGEKAKDGLDENPNPRLERYLIEFRKLAADTKTPLIDHYEHWTNAAAKGTDIAAWTTDQCHPNPRGHQEIVELMLPVVQRVARAAR